MQRFQSGLVFIIQTDLWSALPRLLMFQWDLCFCPDLCHLPPWSLLYKEYTWGYLAFFQLGNNELMEGLMTERFGLSCFSMFLCLHVCSSGHMQMCLIWNCIWVWQEHTHAYIQMLSETALQVDTTVEQLQMVHKSVCRCVCVNVWCLNTEYMGGFIVPHVNKVLLSNIHSKSVSDTFSLTPSTALPTVCFT